MAIFGNKRKVEGQGLSLYGQQLERVRSFTILGVHFEERMSRKVHVDKTVEKCEKVMMDFVQAKAPRMCCGATAFILNPSVASGAK